MTKKYKLLIFDWDGTLVDSQSHIINSMREAIREEGYEIPEDEDIRHIIGLSLSEAVRLLVPDCNKQQMIKVSSAYKKHFFGKSALTSEFFSGAKEVLQACHDEGYLLGIATGKSKRGLEMSLKITELESLFDVTRCAEETESKPGPLMLEEILTDMNLTAADALMIGDTTFDMDMANNIDMDCMAATYGAHRKAELDTSNPTYYLSNIKELPDMLKKL